jgi:hypothetical protein
MMGAQASVQLGAAEGRVGIVVGVVALETSTASAGSFNAAAKAALTLPAKQCAGQGPPASRNEQWCAGCQSRQA